MAEEHRCQARETPLPCANSCGFFGSAATQGLCSKCYRDQCHKQEQEAAAKTAVEKSLSVPAAAPPSSSPTPAAAPFSVPHPAVAAGLPSSAAAAASASASAQPGRCGACRKRVGLTGFRCRCGDTYCGMHRYPEQHGCAFDFKSAGRDAVARANPVVRAEKLDKI